MTPALKPVYVTNMRYSQTDNTMQYSNLRMPFVGKFTCKGKLKRLNGENKS